jgi:hypothetical protein
MSHERAGDTGTHDATSQRKGSHYEVIASGVD